MVQSIPAPPFDHTAFHDIDMRPVFKDWVDVHRDSINIWDDRFTHIVYGELATEPLYYHSEYMKWYRRHTRRWISYKGAAAGASVSTNTYNLLH